MTETDGPHPTLQVWLGDWVDAGLLYSGMTQQQLADKVGISPKHLSQMLNGHVRGTLVMWDRLLAGVGVREAALNRRALRKR